MDDSPNLVAPSVSLNVVNLHYLPRRDRLYHLIQMRDQLFSMKYIREFFPQVKFDVYNPTILDGINFRAFQGEITAVLSNDKDELRTIIEFIVMNRLSGDFSGEILLDGVNTKRPYNRSYAFVPKKITCLPNLSFADSIFYAARLRMYESDYAIITKRVADILQLLDLTECKDEKVENYSINSSEVRRLNIAVEIVGLPPLIVIDEPTVGLEPAHAMAVFASLRAIASRGHIVICAMMRPTSQLFVHVDRAIVLSAGKSIFSAETKYIRQHFTNLGYVYKNEESKLSDFVLDIASGTERPDSQRVSFSPAELQQSFEKSAYFSNPVSGVRSLHALPRKSFLSDYFTAKYRLLFSIHDGCNMIRRQFDHMIVIIHRALKAKRNDVETIKRTFGGAILLGLGLGYLQWQIGNYGDNSLTIIKMTYANTANLTSLLFFVGTLTFSLNVVLIQSLCERVHVFRHEQKMGYQTAISFLVSSAIADGPFSVAAIVVFATTAYFMAALNTGVSNFAYFILAIMCLSVVGLFSAYLFTLLFRKELRVRDSFLFCTFFMLLTSGYLFPLPTLDSNIAKLVALSPIRWFFEAMMHWKFANNYVDGTVYLEVYDYQDFDSDSYFPIMSYFIIFSVCSAYLAAWPNIYTLQRRKDVRTELLEGSGTWDSGRASATFFQDALLNLDSPVGKSQPSSLRRSISETSEAPILFERRPSMSSVARLSVNLSLRGDPEAQTQFRGPTIVFKDLCYSVRNPSASQGYLSVLNNVSGQFDWGKLSLVLGARGSGRSSLLHILAGSRGIAAKVSGVVRFDGEPIDRSTPLWQRCGLVEASDELHGDLTVEDILRFAMQLRCPNLEAFAYVEENVTRTISLLHLDQVRKTRAKRLTNGELKRLSIAEELVHGPGLLLIDEPTTSQDLRDESIMLQTFRELVNQDRTVVASIQTPSERILQLFDVVLLLSKGSVIYHGPMANADKFFTSSPYKFSLNAYDNRGDFLTDISGGYLECADGTIPGSRDLATYFSSGKVSTADETVDDSYNGNSNEKDSLTASNSRRNSKIPTRQSKELTKDDMLVSAKAMLEEPLIPVEKSTSKTLRSQIYKAVPLIYMLPHIIAACIMSMWSYITQLPSTDWDLTLRQSSVIIRRSFLSMYRRKKLWITSIVTYIFLACLLGLLAGNVVLQAYVTISLYAIGPLLLFFTNIQIVYYTFRTDMVFFKEHSRGLYSVFNYWLWASLPVYLLRILNAGLYSAILYSIIGLNTDNAKEAFFTFTTVLIALVGVVCTELVVMCSASLRAAYLTVSVLFLLFFVFCGLPVKASTLPNWLSGATEVSVLRWALQATFINQFDGNTAVFPDLGTTSTYQLYLILFGWQDNGMWYSAGIIVLNIFVYKVLTLLSAGIHVVRLKGGRKFRKDENVLLSLNKLV